MRITAEDEIIEQLIPRIEERVTYKVIQNVIDALEEQIYPPEEMIREELIEEIREAEKRIQEGRGKFFENASELKDFLDHVKEEE